MVLLPFQVRASYSTTRTQLIHSLKRTMSSLVVLTPADPETLRTAVSADGDQVRAVVSENDKAKDAMDEYNA